MFFKHLLLVAYFYTDSPPSDWGFYIVDQLNKVWPLSPCFVAAASAHVSLLTCLLSARSRWLKSKRTADQWRTREHALLFFSFFFLPIQSPYLTLTFPSCVHRSASSPAHVCPVTHDFYVMTCLPPPPPVPTCFSFSQLLLILWDHLQSFTPNNRDQIHKVFKLINSAPCTAPSSLCVSSAVNQIHGNHREWWSPHLRDITHVYDPHHKHTHTHWKPPISSTVSLFCVLQKLQDRW